MYAWFNVPFDGVPVTTVGILVIVRAAQKEMNKWLKLKFTFVFKHNKQVYKLHLYDVVITPEIILRFSMFVQYFTACTKLNIREPL